MERPTIVHRGLDDRQGSGDAPAMPVAPGLHGIDPATGGPRPGRRIVFSTQDHGTGAWIEREQVLADAPDDARFLRVAAWPLPDQARMPRSPLSTTAPEEA